ncbi:MAG: transporter substrate-binding domain-containing protein [Pseudomonadota bacterium]
MASCFFPRPPRLAAALAALVALGLTGAAHAGCSRPIHVPVPSMGAAVVTNGADVSGIYPDALRAQGQQLGCRFVFSAVPRARQEAMFENGKSDLLIPAVQTPRRDRSGRFVPLLSLRPVLISLRSTRAAIDTSEQLLAHPEVRVALVRGYDYGEAYTKLAAQLAKQGRVSMEVDAMSVARLLQGGFVEATIMNSSIISGTAQADQRLTGLLERLRLEPLTDLPWRLSGAYISATAVSQHDQAALVEVLERTAKSGQLMEGFARHHAPDFLLGSVRPR